jgi:alginate O-acetyltransferase complex protein AlgI
MVFTSFEFAVFFIVVVLVRSAIKNFIFEKAFLLLASYCFYMSWSVPLVGVILITSAVDFRIARHLEVTENASRRRMLLAASIVTNVSVLAGFKYSNFILGNLVAALNALGILVETPVLNVALPPGISYFTFTSISYVVDVYYERVPPCRRPLDYALYLAYFPKLLAGPIVRASSFLPQLQHRVRATIVDVETGLAYVLSGLVKKLVISDQIAGHVNLIWSRPDNYDGLTLFQGLVGYAIQIYCDFSGYSDMAVGCARLLGVHLPDNFQFPYSAASMSEFWRRWHITLSEWFRDYVFVPMEVATRTRRNATIRSATNLMATMLLCGIWHGAGWNFVLWGGIHGTALGVERAWTNWNPLKGLVNRSAAFRVLWIVVARSLTLGVVFLAWVFFRMPTISDAGLYLGRLLTWSQDGTRLWSPFILSAVAGFVAVHLLISKDSHWTEDLPRWSMVARVATFSVLLTLVVFLGATDTVPFIYFQF